MWGPSRSGTSPTKVSELRAGHSARRSRGRPPMACWSPHRRGTQSHCPSCRGCRCPVGKAAVLTALRKSQPPFTVTQLAQDAAVETLRHPDRVEERRVANASEREFITSRLEEAGLEVAESQTTLCTSISATSRLESIRLCWNRGSSFACLAAAGPESPSVPNTRIVERSSCWSTY